MNIHRQCLKKEVQVLLLGLSLLLTIEVRELVLVHSVETYQTVHL